MALMKKSDHKAFDELYNRYATSLLQFFYNRLNKNEDKANDFLQDIFMKIIEKPNLFDVNRKFNAWLFSIAHNMCKNEYRKQEVRGRFEQFFDLDSLVDIPSFSNFISKHDVNYFLTSLDLELNNLSKVQQQTFNLRHRESLSLKEISEQMDCSVGTVKSRLHNSVKTLQEKLKPFKAE